MNLKPPSILLPIAGGALAYVASRGSKDSVTMAWAVSAGVLAGMVGNSLLNLAAVKNAAAEHIAQMQGTQARVPGASLGSELMALIDKSELPSYAVQAPQPQAQQAPTSLPPPAVQTTNTDPAALQKWMNDLAAQAGRAVPQGQVMGHVTSGPPPAARKAKPAAARFHAGR